MSFEPDANSGYSLLTMTFVAAIALALILSKWATQLWLARLNERHVRQHADAVPEPFRDIVVQATYTRSVEYTLAKSRLHNWEMTWSVAVLLALLFSSALPQLHQLFVSSLGTSAWSMSAFLFVVGVALSIVGLPFDWYAQFQLEQRFGFNTTTPRLWWVDRLKGLLLTIALGYPLLALVLMLAGQAGTWWWLWAWVIVLGFELMMVVLAPVLIMPLFNKFTPLPEGDLRERLLRLAEQSGFRARSIQVMDGSKRSRHSNAFFTGFGRFRKIVLFDTLIEQLKEAELAAVLAHEIGHYKKGHVPKMLAWSAVSLLAAFGLLAWLAGQEWFHRAFGFEPGSFAPALLLFGLLSGTLTFWLTPLANIWSRRFEYQADAFAARVMGETGSLIGALRKLNEKNLSNLTPHPLYSGFYYSHPAMIERERALARSA